MLPLPRLVEALRADQVRRWLAGERPWGQSSVREKLNGKSDPSCAYLLAGKREPFCGGGGGKRRVLVIRSSLWCIVRSSTKIRSCACWLTP
jgi:hypothetical protein